MLKNFDDERRQRHQEAEDAWGDRSFVFGGATLTFQANPPYQATKALVEISESDPGMRVFAIVEGAVRGILEPHCRAAFEDAVSQDKADPVTWDDLIALAYWLVEQSSSRPTGRSQSSTGGSSGTGTGSTGNSSGAPAVASVN